MDALQVQRSLRRRKRFRESNPEKQSELAYVILVLLAWGRISSVEAQKLAVAGMNDGLKNQYAMLEAIASAGTSGKYAQNTRRDILKRCNPHQKANFAGHVFEQPISKMDHGAWTTTLDFCKGCILSPLRVLEAILP